MNVGTGMHSELRDISFLAAVNDTSRSFKEIFLMVDALIHLEWKVEATFLKQLYCCGAEKSCALPKWTGEFNGVATEESFNNTATALEFAREYFPVVGTRDDLFLIKQNFTAIYDWYKRNSKGMLLANLDNNHLIRMTPLIMRDMAFEGIGGIKLGPDFLSNPKAATAALEAIKQVSSAMPIYDITLADPPNAEAAAIVEFCERIKLPITIVTAEKLAQDRAVEDGTAEEGELYEDHSLFLVQDRFYLHKYDHLGCTTGAFYEVDGKIDPYAFLAGSIKRKIEKYRVMTAGGRAGEYFAWVAEHAKVNEDYTFIPGFMINPNTPFYKASVANGLFHVTPFGLFKTGTPADKIIPLVDFI